MKACTKCGETKPLDAYHVNRTRRDGHSARCRECAAIDQRAAAERRAANGDYVPVAEKRCGGCREVKPADAFARHRRRRDGLNSVCRLCASARQAANAARDDADIVTPAEKLCPSCARVRPSSAFHRDRAARDGLFSRCRECQKASTAAYLARNSARTEAELAAVRAESADSHTCRACGLSPALVEFYTNRSHASGWQTTCAECKRLKDKRYRAVVVDALTELGHTECGSCRRAFTAGVRIEIDHVNPRKLGGADGLGNYQLLCNSCNSSKGATPFAVWLGRVADWTADDITEVIDFHARRRARLDARRGLTAA